MQKNYENGYFLYHINGKEDVQKIISNSLIDQNIFFQFNGKAPDEVNEGETVKIPCRLSGCIVGRFYRLKRNDSLKAIAKRQGIKVAELLEHNPYVNPAKVFLGQVIVLPQSVQHDYNLSDYTVEKNDALADILRKFDLSIQELQEENPKTDVFCLKPGQVLHIRKKECFRKRNYVLQENETLISVARKFNQPVIEILKANPNLRPLEIKQGIRIILP